MADVIPSRGIQRRLGFQAPIFIRAANAPGQVTQFVPSPTSALIGLLSIYSKFCRQETT